MTKKKTETIDATVEAMASESETQKRIKELEDLIRNSEEQALERVCKAMGIDPNDIKKAEVKKTERSQMVRMFVHYPVRVNSNIYQGDVTIPLDTSRVIQQALGDRRMRLLRELTGNNYILKELQGGGWAPQLIGQIGIDGERIA